MIFFITPCMSTLIVIDTNSFQPNPESSENIIEKINELCGYFDTVIVLSPIENIDRIPIDNGKIGYINTLNTDSNKYQSKGVKGIIQQQIKDGNVCICGGNVGESILPTAISINQYNNTQPYVITDRCYFKHNQDVLEDILENVIGEEKLLTEEEYLRQIV